MAERAAFEEYISADEVGDVEKSFKNLLTVLGLEDTQGQGLLLFDNVRERLTPKLNFGQKRLFTNLSAQIKNRKELTTSKGLTAMICGAGPVGLRAAVELAMLDFNVIVIEKRPTFSRVNIITFWGETMNDMVSLGAKVYCPNILTSGDIQFMGTRQIQLSLLKTFLLLGGKCLYGKEIFGLLPPDGAVNQWQGRFRPYAQGRRLKQMDASTAAVDFNNKSEVPQSHALDQSFLAPSNKESDEHRIPFDLYFVAEGSWSDSTRKLGFTKLIQKYNPVIGLVINCKYNKDNPTEKNMKSTIHHALNKDFPLKSCNIVTEFVEYLKGDTHYFALVVAKTNIVKKMSQEKFDEMMLSDSISDDIKASCKQSRERVGLLDMGVLKKDYSCASQLLHPSNIDIDKLHRMARCITTDCGLPTTTEFAEVNPVQLFDFSTRSRCIHPMKILHQNTVLDGTIEHATSIDNGHVVKPALVLPIGDALQEPLWTEGLGVNRGFHGALNAVHAAVLYRESGKVASAVNELDTSYRALIRGIKWGAGSNGLAGAGSSHTGLAKQEKWTCNPRDRFPKSAFVLN